MTKGVATWLEIGIACTKMYQNSKCFPPSSFPVALVPPPSSSCLAWITVQDKLPLLSIHVPGSDSGNTGSREFTSGMCHCVTCW